MQIKLIALDLDGTALRSNNTLSAAVAEAIEAAAGSAHHGLLAILQSTEKPHSKSYDRKDRKISCK